MPLVSPARFNAVPSSRRHMPAQRDARATVRPGESRSGLQITTWFATLSVASALARVVR